MPPIPDIRIETERLVLRPPVLADFDAWARFSADPEVTRYIGGAQPRATAWRGFTGMAGSWALLGFGMFSVLDRAGGHWLGRIGPWQPESWPGTEVGWALVREAQGKGLAFEATTAAMDFAFDRLGWREVIHCIDDDNRASAALARRLGSTPWRRTRLPPPFDTIEVQVWGQTREQWRQRRA